MSFGKYSAKLVTGILQPWWRLTRATTLGAQGVVIDARSHVLLVRHGYRPGWFFPGGGVERHETLEMALDRELREEAGVELTARPKFHGLFANIEKFPGDHVAVFVVRSWEQPRVPGPNVEIAEQGFFAYDDLPPGTGAGTKRRLAEIFEGQVLSEKW